jgi:hypothetical protein
LDHVLDNQVAVQLMGVIILVATTPVLVGPLYPQSAVFTLIGSTLEIFLQKNGMIVN